LIDVKLMKNIVNEVLRNADKFIKKLHFQRGNAPEGLLVQF